MKPIVVEINNEEVSGFVQKINGQLWVHLDGETFTYKPEGKGKSGSQGPVSSDPRFIKSPMPGKIIKVQASVGKDCKEGETLIVMEAMKMEYTLTAVKNAKVKKVNCSEGQQVGLGETLIEMEVIDE